MGGNRFGSTAWLGAGLAGALALTACGSVRWDTSWPEPRPLGADMQTFRPPRAAGASEVAASFEEPAGVLHLKDALGYALLGNPRLTAFSWDVRAHEARTLQASLPANPVVTFRSEDILGSGDFSGFTNAETTISLGQLIELGGKRRKRHRVADLGEDVAGWDYEAERIDVFTSTAQDFAAVLAAQERLALEQDLVRLAEESLKLVDTEIGEGKIGPVEHTRAKVAVSAARVSLERTRAELLTARSNLAASWGSDQEEFFQVEGDLEGVREPPTLESLIARIDRNPDLARWMTEVERRRAVVESEKAERFPSVFVEGGFRRLSAVEESAMVVGIGLPIPLIDRNQGNILAAKYDLKKAEVEQRATRLHVLTRLAAADDRLRGAYVEVTSLRRDVLPAAETVYEQLLADFDAGRYPYDDLLDAQRVLFAARVQHLDALEAYHLAVADVERLIGGPLWDPAMP